LCFQASYSKAGDIFRIDYSLQKADTLERIASDHVTGRNDESFPSLVDEITKRIKIYLRLSEEQLSSDIDKETGMITTSSPDAYKYYSIGRKTVKQVGHQASLELMEQAVAIDPEFAMAYRSMAISYRILGFRKKAKEMFQKAMEHKDRLSDRDRLRIEADYYLLSESTYDKAIESYLKILDIYPDSPVRNNLAVAYGWIGEYQNAVEHLETYIKTYKSDSVLVFSNVFSFARRLGWYDKARETLQYYLNHFPDHPSIHRMLAQTYWEQTKYELALEEIEKAFVLSPTDWYNNRFRGDIYYYMGDLIKAEAEYRMLLQRDERNASYWGLQRLSRVFLIQGKFDESTEYAERALELAEELSNEARKRDQISYLAYMDRITGKPEEALNKYDICWKSAVEVEDFADQRMALHQKGVTYLEIGQTSDAQRVTQELKEIIEPSPIKYIMRTYYHLLGMIEIEKKNYAQAIEYFELGLALLRAVSEWRIIFTESIGWAYYESGDLKKAGEEYERIINNTANRMAFGNVYAKSSYMLGKIHEQQGDTAKAIESYEKFLDLWKDADPGIAEVEDARKRLAGLK